MQLVIAEKPSVARDLARVLGVRAGGGGTCFEGERCVITWCIGHLVELEEPAAYDGAWRAWRMDRLPMIPREFLLRPSRHAAPQLRAVAALLRDRRFREVINACDAGREGELIFRYVYQHAGARLPIRRLWVSSLTDEAIARGFAALRTGEAMEPLADAARSRSEADWLVGMNATRAITVRGREGGGEALYSIGRVQTPTLAMLVERERAIRAFVPTPYWEVRFAGGGVTAWWRAAKVGSPKPELVGRFGAREVAEAIVARDGAGGAGRGRDAAAGAASVGEVEVERVEGKTTREPPPMLFDLTSLQRTANRRYGLSAARTLELAQALYERHKLVTYPRTDSRHLSSDLVAELPALVAALGARGEYAAFAAPLVANGLPRLSRRFVDDTKVSDHHAIIPTPAAGRDRALDRDEARIFDLIARRFLGAFYPDAEFAITDAWLRATAAGAPGMAGAKAPAFGPLDREVSIDALPPPPDRYHARGRVRTVAGWQEVAGIEASAAAPAGERERERGRPGEDEAAGDVLGVLPQLVVGQRLAGGFASVARETTPPPRYTEATLLGAMESAGRTIDDEALRAAMRDSGLGTPATRASIIETLLVRDYIVRDRQALVPTAMGEALIAAIPVPSLASPELTGAWEARLAAIARGADTRAAFMADIARFVREVVEAIRTAPPPATLPGSPPPARFGGGGGGGGGRRFGKASGKYARGRSGGGGGGGKLGKPSRGGARRRGGSQPRAIDDADATLRGATGGGARDGAAVATVGAGRAAAPANDWWQHAKRAMGTVESPGDAGAASPAAAARAVGEPRASARRDVVSARAPDTVVTPAPAKPRRAAAPPTPGSVTKHACPRCGAGTVIAGNRGWGCSRWREGCDFVLPFAQAKTARSLARAVGATTAPRVARSTAAAPRVAAKSVGTRGRGARRPRVKRSR